MTLITTERKYDTSDSIGQRVIFWKSSKISTYNNFIVVENAADFYEENTHNYIGQITFVFGTKCKVSGEQQQASEFIKKIIPNINKLVLSPGQTLLIPIIDDGSKEEDIMMNLHKYYYGITGKQESNSPTNNPRKSSFGMSPASYGLSLGWMVNAPLALVLVFIMPIENAILVLSPIVIGVFFYGVLSNMNEDDNLVEELITAHFAGLFIGVPTWHEIALLYWFFI